MSFPMRARFRVGLVLAIAGATGGCLRNPKADAEQAALNIQMSDAVNDLRLEASELHGSLDSLRTVVAKQDSTIQRLAAATGVPVVK